ncbi:hypothetical protein COCNU_11G002020 [Cocos nucifera]|uniref:Uncharacterized protein n=1 Tax=Cocos nucifera TaxID=13894 RepID=A0A8K0INS6_COCNU|nr:hypothetical protein COCNU_11G002020 [Cocos nucifera]
MKEAKIVEKLKKQLQKKLAIIEEKNKALMDHQRKANEGEKKLLELLEEVSKIFELETKVKELEKIVASRDDNVAARDKALLVYQRDIERCKATTVRAVEDYNSLEAFQEEVAEASDEAFDYEFVNCKSLLKKLFSDLDLSNITQEMAIQLMSNTPI